jgi:hypothetical protein
MDETDEFLKDDDGGEMGCTIKGCKLKGYCFNNLWKQYKYSYTPYTTDKWRQLPNI